MEVTYQQLKDRQRQERSDYHENLSLRVHRALSWLDKAEKSTSDLDTQFIHLWISFNAAYANAIDDKLRFTEQKKVKQFITKLVELDNEEKLSNLLWEEFSGSIRLLLANKYVFQPFWDFHNLSISEEQWSSAFKSANTTAHKALGNKDTKKVLGIVFSRLYTLRNQIIHGGATCNSNVNRNQVKDAVAFLSKCIPIMIELMMDNHNELWGEPWYPVVNQ